jgi:hypothetical protein
MGEADQLPPRPAPAVDAWLGDEFQWVGGGDQALVCGPLRHLFCLFVCLFSCFLAGVPPV